MRWRKRGQLSGAARPAISVTLNQRPWFNEGLEDRWFIPGAIGMLRQFR